MKMKNKDHRPLFSILGDSISTLEGYTEPEDAAFYEGLNKLQADIFSPEDTWWGQVIRSLDGELLVNHSFSGSMVCRHRNCLYPSYGCSDERTSALDRNGMMPDVIMVFMGTNDWGHGMKLMPDDPSDHEDISIFSVAYQKMLEKLISRYPSAEIWCFTLPVSMCTKKDTYLFPYKFGGIHIEEYCEIIRLCAEKYRCRVIDLYRYAKPFDTIDGFHPNAEGMKSLSADVLALL